MMTLMIFIVVLAVLILTHELGHFLAAKWVGVKVEEFGLGFPPRIKAWKKGETVYSLNALPIGGFVRLLGEDGVEEDNPEKVRSLSSQKRYWQALILTAGVFANFLVAWVLLSIGLVAGLPMSLALAPAGAIISDSRVAVVGIQKGGPAQLAGLEVGDILLSVTTKNNYLVVQDIPEVQSLIASSVGEGIKIEVNRSGQRIFIVATTTMNVDLGRAIVGFQMDKLGVVAVPWWKAPWISLKLCGSVVVGTLGVLGNLLRSLFVGGGVGGVAVTGPVGLAVLVGDAARLGWIYLLSFVAIISLNLAILNILPLPALDGGRLLVLGVEAILRRNLPVKFLAIVNATGFVFLLLVMVLVTYFDILKVFGV